MIAPLLDHLWQSTLFAGGASLLALALRRNSAGLRYWIWFGASLKFLVPFAALTALAERALAPFQHTVATPIYWTLQPAAHPFTAMPVLPAGQMPALAMAAGWALGLLAITAMWLVRWSRLRQALQGATTLDMGLPLPVRSTATLMEPGLVGLWRPVILLPRGIEAALSAQELKAVLAHELCHWRRRDNLMATAHMLVSALFWFHPMVWWIGARLVAERENACDESVLDAGNNPQAYAECILKVCRFYLQSPLPCAPGVAGANLHRRVEAIMANRLVADVDGARSLLLVLAVGTALLLPPVAGVLATAPVARLADRITSAIPRLPVGIAVVAPVETHIKPQPHRAMPTPPAAAQDIAARAVKAVAFRDAMTVIQPALLPGSMVAFAGPDDLACRPPEILTESRLRGPMTCATRSRWAQLKADNLDIAPDGKTIIPDRKKSRSLNPPPCIGSLMGANTTAGMSIPNPCL